MSKANWLTAVILLAIFAAALPLSFRGDPWVRGEEALAAGDADRAVELWRQEVERDPAPPPELILDLALASLGAERWTDAEIAAERLVAADSSFAAAREFLQANARFGRARQAELRADLPEAEPFAYDLAIGLVRRAKSGWIAALLSGAEDWPAARRNAERADLALARLEAKKQKKLEEQKKKTEQNPPPEEPEPEEPEMTEEDIALEAATAELPVDEVRQLLERLAVKEREKRALRQSERAQRGGSVDRDW